MLRRKRERTRGRAFGPRWLAASAALSLALGCGGGDAAPQEENVEVLDLRCGVDAPAVSTRRLTRFEYANTLKDVLGMDVALDELFPPDEESYGFENQADTITVTDLHVDGYLRVAEQVADALETRAWPADALPTCDVLDPDCVNRFVRDVGERLLRRPLSAGESERLLAFFQGVTFREGAANAVAALLSAPEFLYRVERASGGELAAPAVLASRLSFLLWGSVPDQALLDSVKTGRLESPADVRTEAERMLTDPRARRGLLHFYEYWLGLSHFEMVEKDRRLFTRWNDELKRALVAETLEFVDRLLWDEGARLETLLGASFTYATSLVADFYGLAPGTGSAAMKVQHAAAEGRRGILGHGAILSQLATANQTSPIHRGKFVREKLFCTIPPPPPPDLVVFPPALDPANQVTTRERFAAHRSDVACNGCHEMLDPIGFGFEHFDATGRYREREGQNEIDDSGYLVATDVDGAFEGMPGLSAKLLESAQVRRCVATQWFRYAFGRGETEADQCTLDRLSDVFSRTGGDLKQLMLALTQTTPFLSPAPAPAEEAP